MANTIAFDEAFYLSQNPDVAAAVSRGIFTSGAQHFEEFGRFEARDPNAFFDTSYYLGRYPDVAQAGVNPLTHFLNFGAVEERFANANAAGQFDTDGNGSANEFDAAAYLAAYEDVRNAGVDPYKHFIEFGQFEGRTATLTNGTTITGPLSNSGTVGNGTTITLSTQLDGPNAVAPAVNTNGTNGDDLYIADNNTLTTDTINGGGGIDTLRITNTATAGTTFAPTLSSVERIELSTLGGAATTLNLVNSTGVQTVARTSGANLVTIAQAPNLIALESNGITAGQTNLTYSASVVAGTDDVQKVTFGTGTPGTITANGIETFDVTTNGTTTVAGLASNTLSTVKFAGAGALTVTNVLTGATTVDASAIGAGAGTADAGSINVSLDTTKDVTVIGGAGNDVFNFGAGLTVADKVDGGAGTDVVRVTSVGNYSSADAAAPFNAFTSIEKVGFDGATGVTLNGATFTNTGITNIEFNTTGDDIINNAGSARTYEFGTANTGDATFTMTAGATTLNIDLLGTTGTTAVSGASNTVEIDALTVTPAGVASATNVTSITLSSLGNFTAGTISETAGTLGLTADTFNSVGEITAARGSTLTIDGNAALEIASSAANITINASALTGSLVVRGSAIDAADVGEETTGATTTAQTGVDTITLGSGRDVVQFGADGFDSGIIVVTGTGATAANSGNVLVDVINGFTAGANGDVLDILTKEATYTSLAADSQTEINALSGADATLLAAANLASAGHTEAGWTAFSFQGQTYALYEGATGTANFANADTLVQLAGVNVADLTTANFA
ncbi:beta strand repeat-containing protein [Aureimonas ureilytica]|uniref:beta strand repeat-containing protein n=1 Tax=Aureimonas ureilytica TaxID=401562 RepID=UPI003CEE4337